MATSSMVFLCGECKRPFASRPDRWFHARTESDADGTERRFCECGNLLATIRPLKWLAVAEERA